MNNREKFQKMLDEVHNEALRNDDYTIGFNSLRMDETGELYSNDDERGEAELTDFAMTRLMQFSKMPVSYMKKLREEAPDLLAQQFNMWASKQKDDYRLLLRSQERNNGRVIRGVLSDKYTILDNTQVLSALMDVADDIPDFEVVSRRLDDVKFHTRIAFPDIKADFGPSIEGKDDIIRVGLDIQNSEVGYASLSVAPITYRLICSNGLKAWKQEDSGVRYRHVHMTTDELVKLMREAMDESITSGKALLKKMEDSRKVDVDNPYELIDEKVLEYGLSKKMGNRIKEAYDIEPERNLLGVVNGFTRGAQKVENMDSRMQIEKVASQLMYA